MKKIFLLLSVMLLINLTLTACGASTPVPTATQSVGEIQTAAVLTFSAGLTQTALFAPTATETPAPIPTNTPFPVTLINTLAATSTGGGAADSCNKLVYITDVTIPDNTVVTPGQSFTKTWRVQNTGSCPWTTSYKFALIGGDAMNGQTLTLPQAVNPSTQYEISIPMTAPTNKTGTITGTWRMSDAAGVYFGDALTVVVVIGSASVSPTATATINANASATPTSTATPTTTSTP